VVVQHACGLGWHWFSELKNEENKTNMNKMKTMETKYK
jgi:hypothetical protein